MELKQCDPYWLLVWSHKHGADVAVCDHEPEYEDSGNAILRYFGEEPGEWDEDRDELDLFGPRTWLSTKKEEM